VTHSGVRRDQPLTAREIEVVTAVSGGRSNREAADVLGIGADTVRIHLARIGTKLGATGRTEIIAAAVRSGQVRSVSLRAERVAVRVASHGGLSLRERAIRRALMAWADEFEVRVTVRQVEAAVPLVERAVRRFEMAAVTGGRKPGSSAEDARLIARRLEGRR
jgi:DNA-binding CsgD family transcriptional regulator